MSRSIGFVDIVQDALPDWIGLIAALITQLGDSWFILLLILLLLIVTKEKSTEIGFLGLAWLLGKLTYVSMKQFFKLPRPDMPIITVEKLPTYLQSIYEATGFSSGYGFPSGHAVNATIIYIGLALIIDYRTIKERLVGAVFIAFTVGMTRVVLGLHYFVDIVAGFAIGGIIVSLYYILVIRE